MKDLTNLKTFIIDSKDPKEIDDAISIEFLEKSTYIWVHLSYPVKLFKFNSEIDLEARNKSSSLYLIDNYRPMLPLNIIDEANLKRNKISESLSARIELNENGSIKNYEIFETLIRPDFQYTYDDVNELLDLQPIEEYELIHLNKILKKSLTFRLNNGAIIFNTFNPKINIINNNIIFEKNDITEAHNLVSESMILMSFIISDFLLKNKIPAPFRSQKINCNVEEILEKNKDSLIKYSILKQYIGKSFISIKHNKHETLGLVSYVQSTAPLRRYIDLIVQRQLYLYFNNLTPLKEDEINMLIGDYKIRQSENNNIIKDNKMFYLKKYFNNNANNLYRIIFIRWINYKRNIALVFFPDLWLETLINLYSSSNTYQNKIYKVQYNCNEESNLLEFLS